MQFPLQESRSAPGPIAAARAEPGAVRASLGDGALLLKSQTQRHRPKDLQDYKLRGKEGERKRRKTDSEHGLIPTVFTSPFPTLWSLLSMGSQRLRWSCFSSAWSAGASPTSDGAAVGEDLGHCNVPAAGIMSWFPLPSITSLQSLIYQDKLGRSSRPHPRAQDSFCCSALSPWLVSLHFRGSMSEPKALRCAEFHTSAGGKELLGIAVD